MVSEKVHCDKHGQGRVAFVCTHLNSRTQNGFHEEFESHFGQDLPPQTDFAAWCYACEQVRAKAGEWNEENESFANIKVVCESCYFELKALNL